MREGPGLGSCTQTILPCEWQADMTENITFPQLCSKDVQTTYYTYVTLRTLSEQNSPLVAANPV